MRACVRACVRVCVRACVRAEEGSSAAAGVQSRSGFRAGDAPWMESGEKLSEEACLTPPETTQATGAESLDWMQDCLAVHYALMP